METLLDFQNKDYLYTRLENESFDVVWAMESVIAAEDKIEFLKEAIRILKKDGTLIIGDYFSKAEIDANESFPYFQESL